jgi:signal transduction histidine kinase
MQTRQERFGLLGFVVLALAALFNVAALYTAERSFTELRDTAAWVRHTLVTQNLIEHLYRLVVDAETGQRGFLLTQDNTYLAPYVDAKSQIQGKLKELSEVVADNPVQRAQLATVSQLLDTRMSQLEESLAVKRSAGDDALREFLLTHQGQITMTALRLALDGMAAEERVQHDRRLVVFAENQTRVRRWFFLEVGINLFLVVSGGIFLAQDARRRRREAKSALMQSTHLAQLVQERTAEITELSHYLQRLQEDEKAKIAREIHDDLGGTLAAAKIDLQLLSDKLPGDDPQQVRVARIMAAIDDAVQVKRRITEDLRPTLLDNLGIGAALRWQCSEYGKRSGAPCRVELADENLRLSAAYSITFYRIVQEALTNIAKYATAKNVAVSLQRVGERWVLRVADDGVGLDPSVRHNATAHGIVSMRERARALGGEFSIQGQRGRGTVVEVTVPIERDTLK